MLDRLYMLYYDMQARGFRPSHWIVGSAALTELLQLREPDGGWIAQPGSIQKGPTILGLPWKIDHKNPMRLELAPSSYGGAVLRDSDASVLVEFSTEDADRILKQVFG